MPSQSEIDDARDEYERDRRDRRDWELKRQLLLDAQRAFEDASDRLEESRQKYEKAKA